MFQIGCVLGFQQWRALVQSGLPTHQLDGESIATLLATDLAVGLGKVLVDLSMVYLDSLSGNRGHTFGYGLIDGLFKISWHE